MTVLTGLLILLAVVIAAGLAVLGTIASAVEIVPPWFGRGEESLNTALSPRPAQLLRGRGSKHARLIGHPRPGVRTGYPRGSV